MNFYLDFEATRFSNRIISIGCVAGTGETFETYVNPGDKKKVDKVQAVMDIAQATTSLDTPVDDDGETSMGDLIADHSTENPVANMIKEANKQIVASILDTLGSREAEILKMRFGIDAEKAMTLEEVGDHYGLSKERIRQIENKAIRKLRNPVRAKMLKEAMV